jgi:hypothetical protein
MHLRSRIDSWLLSMQKVMAHWLPRSITTKVILEAMLKVMAPAYATKGRMPPAHNDGSYGFCPF